MKKAYLAVTFAAVMSVGLSGCGGSKPEWETVYEDCKAKMTEASEQMKSEAAASGEQDPQAQAMAEAMGNMVITMGMAACESIKQVCEEDPNGETCQGIVREYQKDSQ